MKVTIEVPDELYRRVKAHAALEGRSVRDLTTEYYAGLVGPVPQTGEPAPAPGGPAYPRTITAAEARELAKQPRAPMTEAEREEYDRAGQALRASIAQMLKDAGPGPSLLQQMMEDRHSRG